MKYTNIQNVVIYKNILFTFLNEDSYAHQGCIILIFVLLLFHYYYHYV